MNVDCRAGSIPEKKDFGREHKIAAEFGGKPSQLASRLSVHISPIAACSKTGQFQT